MSEMIFIDTEFTDFSDPQLISIGLVTDDGAREFYAELPVDQSRCNDFVLTTVLPQLGKVPNAQCSRAALAENLRAWLAQYRKDAPVTICFDYEGDWVLFCDALGPKVPDWIQGKNIYSYIDQKKWLMYFIENRVSEHHALNDAKANRYAFDAERAKGDPMQFKKS